MTTTHTPAPWTAGRVRNNPIFDIIGPNVTGRGREIIGSLHTTQNKQTDDANAAHIVHCVNTYPALLAALKKLSGEVLDLSERYDEEDVISEPARLALKEAISAIAQAEGRP